jgi:hypothetical protein
MWYTISVLETHISPPAKSSPTDIISVCSRLVNLAVHLANLNGSLLEVGQISSER